MRVTSKGQVTIPVDVRRELGIQSGSEVEFVRREDGVVELIRANPQERAAAARVESVRKWVEQLAANGPSIDLNGMTADEYMEWLRGPNDDIDPR